MRAFSLLFLISAIHGIFLIAIMLAHSRKGIKANFLLVLLLSIVSGYLIKEHIILEGHFETFPHLMAVFVPLLYLLGPIYYFYVKFLLDEHTRFALKDSIHLVPALICFFTILPFYMKSGEEKLALYSAPSPENFKLATNRIFFYGLMPLTWFWYSWKSLKLINDKNKVVDGRRSKHLKTKLRWLKSYSRIFLSFLCVFLLAQLLIVFTDFYSYYIMLITILVFSVLIHTVGYWAVKESRITGTEQEQRGAVLSESNRRDLKENILNILLEEKAFLRSDLNAEYFCRRLSVNSNYLSHVINREFNCNLTYLINTYRIEAAKEMIMDPKYEHLNLLGIATEVGFNTKNTFTRSFKRHTGMTPSGYKKRGLDFTNIKAVEKETS